VGLVGGYEEAGVLHPKRIEDAFLKKLFERLAADEADEIADHVGRDRIVPGLARGKFQRNFGEIRDHGLQCSRFLHLADFQFAIGRVHIAALLEAVGEARSVPHQIHDQHRRDGGRVRKAGQKPAWNTPRFFHSGIYLWTGSSSAMRPSSTSIMKAMLVIGLVME
jgi:hypothetical protein